jgi:hypothetical protein
MKHIVLYSGGANSAYVAWLVNQKHHKNTILLHTPTYAEHPDADRFRKQFADFLKLPITIAENGKSLWEDIEYNKCLPSQMIPFCSKDLKQEPAKKFYKTIKGKFKIYLGYGVDEWRRIQKQKVRLEAENIESEYPLFDLQITDEQVKNTIRQLWGICLPEPYLYLKHNNCLPCFKGGKQHFYQVWKHYPEYFEKAIQAEIKLDHTVFKDRSLVELREAWKAQIPMFTDDEDLRPCMCAL